MSVISLDDSSLVGPQWCSEQNALMFLFLFCFLKEWLNSSSPTQYPLLYCVLSDTEAGRMEGMWSCQFASHTALCVCVCASVSVSVCESVKVCVCVWKQPIQQTSIQRKTISSMRNTNKVPLVCLMLACMYIYCVSLPFHFLFESAFSLKIFTIRLDALYLLFH